MVMQQSQCWTGSTPSHSTFVYTYHRQVDQICAPVTKQYNLIAAAMSRDWKGNHRLWGKVNTRPSLLLGHGQPPTG